MAITSSQKPSSGRWLSSLLAVAIGVGCALAVSAGVPESSVGAARIVPSIGSYLASGKGDPSSYLVRAQVKQKGGRKVISAQVKDTCGGFATFVQAAIEKGPGGVPVFSARAGVASISGRWASSTRITGTVKTPCAPRQEYVMHLSG
jgi:hypothetical protein